MLASTPLVSPRNRILNALPSEEFQRILPKLKFVEIPHGGIIYNVGEPINHVYFPETSVVSTINYFEDGASLETGIIGKEGMTGVGIALSSGFAPRETRVQTPGDAWQMTTEDFRLAFESNTIFQHLVLRYVFAFFEQVAQSGACVNTHPVSRRLAKWLLMCHDRTEGDDLQITQDFMAQMLGVNRPSITVAAIQLKDEGLIKYSRGVVCITDRKSLEHASCECYELINLAYEHYLSAVELRRMTQQLEQLNGKLSAELERRYRIQKTTDENIRNLKRAVGDIKNPPTRVRVCRKCQKLCDHRNNPKKYNEFFGKRVNAEFVPVVCSDCGKF